MRHLRAHQTDLLRAHGHLPPEAIKHRRLLAAQATRDTIRRFREDLMRVGVSGHSNLMPECLSAVRAAIASVLVELPPPLVGVTCLAPGADQLFARVVLELGGQVEVVLPAMDYRDKLKPHQVAAFDELRAAASLVNVLPHLRAGRQAYVAANERMLASVELLVAVWDGRPAAGRGGTADVVDHAHASGVPVRFVWPPGARRGW